MGIFESHSGVGTVLHSGSSSFDAKSVVYRLRGSGQNMWSTTDSFQFAWKRMTGDLEVTADIRFLNSKGNQHKKAGLIFRQSLQPNSPYVDVAFTQ